MTTFQILLVLVTLGALLVGLHARAQSRVSKEFRRLTFHFAVADALLRIGFILNRQMRAYTRYVVAVKGFDRAIRLRDAFDQQFVMTQDPEMAARIRQTSEYAEISAYYDRKLAKCITYFKTMTEAEVREIASLFAEAHLENMVPVETIAEFFRGERDMIVKTPHLAVAHMERSGTFIMDLRAKALTGTP